MRSRPISIASSALRNDSLIGVQWRRCLTCMGQGSFGPHDGLDYPDVCEECQGKGKVLRPPQPY